DLRRAGLAVIRSVAWSSSRSGSDSHYTHRTGAPAGCRMKDGGIVSLVRPSAQVPAAPRQVYWQSGGDPGKASSRCDRIFGEKRPNARAHGIWGDSVMRELAPRPMTGAEYVESLRDGRDMYIDGERVADVTAHPAFRNAV